MSKGQRVHPSDSAILSVLPPDVDLDVAQVSSAADVLPKVALSALQRLVSAHKVEVLQPPKTPGPRFRRIVA
jgi:hypothetical protein